MQRLLSAEELMAKAIAARPPVRLWDHNCPVEGAGFFVGVGETCAWCGAEQPAP
jgi:hypothetical protein